MTASRLARLREALTAYAFVLPSLIPLTVFTLYPLASSGYLSLVRWNLLLPVKRFVCLANYAAMPADAMLRRVFLNTGLYTMVVVLGGVFLGFVLALLLTARCGCARYGEGSSSCRPWFQWPCSRRSGCGSTTRGSA